MFASLHLWLPPSRIFSLIFWGFAVPTSIPICGAPLFSSGW